MRISQGFANQANVRWVMNVIGMLYYSENVKRNGNALLSLFGIL